MKILVPSQGEDIISKIDNHFAKAKHFIFMDTDKDVWEIFENEFIHEKHSGDKIANKAKELNIDTFIVKNIGPHAFDILTNQGVKIFYYEKGSIKDAISKVKKNELSQMFKANKKHSAILGED